MAYVQDWERLSDALNRVTAAGLKDGEAKRDICNAIADRKIEVRFLVAKQEGGFELERVGGTVRIGREVDIPPELKPKDFDWRSSRPLRPWRPIGNDIFAGHWHLKWIELRRADVSTVLCGMAKPQTRPPEHHQRESMRIPLSQKTEAIGAPAGANDDQGVRRLSMDLPDLAWLTLSEAAERVRRFRLVCALHPLRRMSEDLAPP
ncbi:MAG TPA: hypothetical protein VMD53_08850 [Rhizomicrobium sp.]|nr:hypothetical protein [Rhizomicrobium sp.]